MKRQVSHGKGSIITMIQSTHPEACHPLCRFLGARAGSIRISYILSCFILVLSVAGTALAQQPQAQQVAVTTQTEKAAGGQAAPTQPSAADQAAAQAAAAQELAKKLANPLASLISVPIQVNFDNYSGPGHGSRLLTNIQPVIPTPINKDWNLISRTIVPLIQQNNLGPGSGSQFGLGDMSESAFFSPAKPTGGIIWGAGPVIMMPTATDKLLGGGKWGAGPTFVMLKQNAGTTMGILLNHVWSVAGDSDRRDVSATFIQPFLAIANKGGVTYGLNTETNYDWKGHGWSVPLNVSVSQVTKFQEQLVQLMASLRYWVTSPDGGPHGFGVRAGITLLFPK